MVAYPKTLYISYFNSQFLFTNNNQISSRGPNMNPKDSVADYSLDGTYDFAAGGNRPYYACIRP